MNRREFTRALALGVAVAAGPGAAAAQEPPKPLTMGLLARRAARRAGWARGVSRPVGFGSGY